MKILRYFIFLVLLIILLYLNLTVKIPIILRFLNPLILCCFMCLYRIAGGPTPADRAVGVDILGIIVVGFCGILSAFTKKAFFIDIGVAWALQSFIGAIAIAKYMEGKKLDE